MMRPAVLLFAVLLAACSGAPGDPRVTPTMQNGLAAYRDGDAAGVERAAATLEQVGLPAAYAGALRLRAMKTMLGAAPFARLIYAERLCDAQSWAVDNKADVSGCEGAQGVLTGWRLSLIAAHPWTVVTGGTESELVQLGYLWPSPRRILGPLTTVSPVKPTVKTVFRRNI